MKSRKPIFVVLILILLFNLQTSEATIWKRCNLSNLENLNKNSFDYCSQARLDEFYRSLDAGVVVPNGSFNGKVQLPQNEGGIISEIMDIIPSLERETAEFFMERAWKGKKFYRTDNEHAVLFNRILENYIPNVFRSDLGEPDFKEGWLKKSGYELFPAHVYIGHSLFDESKPSIVIDYSNNQNIEGYRPRIDWVVNENGLEIRDEIRSVNRSIYLGRAYVRGQFLLNFVLEGKVPVTPRNERQ